MTPKKASEKSTKSSIVSSRVALAPVSKTDTSLKSLAIVFDNNTDAPSYHFTGNWTGRDAKAVSYNLTKAYKRHQRAVRLDNIKNTEKEI